MSYRKRASPSSYPSSIPKPIGDAVDGGGQSRLVGRIMIVDGAYLIEMVAEKSRELVCEFCGNVVEPPFGHEVMFCRCGAGYMIGVFENCNGHERKIVYNYDPEKRCVVDGFSSWATEELSQSGLVPVTFLRSEDGRVQAKLDDIADSHDKII